MRKAVENKVVYVIMTNSIPAFRRRPTEELQTTADAGLFTAGEWNVTFLRGVCGHLPAEEVLRETAAKSVRFNMASY